MDGDPECPYASAKKACRPYKKRFPSKGKGKKPRLNREMKFCVLGH